LTRHSEEIRRKPTHRRLPWSLWLGVAVFAIGAAGDLAHHTIESLLPHGLERLLGPEAVNAHMVTLLGMVLIMVGVIRFGTRHTVQRQQGGGKESETAASKEM
jgi:hypothetical protein